MFRKILVANRGEIAVRIIRACREMGIETVAVYSEADASACHAQLADQAVCIGPADPRESYLNPYNILSAASVTGADALHPGYGFLSENPKFAGMCKKSNIVFIGPDMECMEKMSDKLQARRIASRCGVPIVPGSTEPLQDFSEADTLAAKVGYPVMLKAASSGGGRGIRRIETPEQLKAEYASALQEAAAVDGGALYLEKCIDNARHIEVQVLFDHQGNGVHLFERECSLQRRNQKVVEESPSPYLTEKKRQEICRAALKVARSAGYHNAGTVEFLVDSSMKHYFMEMNTRIQVEHPVTEMITGIDIVKQQIRLAAGERLSFGQPAVKRSGHAIECRINAEDIGRNFMPCSGTVHALHIPGGVNVRFDTDLYTGCVVPPYYDSLLGKLIVRDENRDLAMAKMRSALSELMIGGLETNIDFQIDLLLDERVIQGKLDIGLVNRMMEE